MNPSTMEDEMSYREEVKKRHHYLANQLKTGEHPNPRLLSLDFSGFHAGTLEKCLKIFKF
ncbi:MAG: hypothetical protein VB778_00265 [Nitrospinaceae bacterium]